MGFRISFGKVIIRGVRKVVRGMLPHYCWGGGITVHL